MSSKRWTAATVCCTTFTKSQLRKGSYLILGYCDVFPVSLCDSGGIFSLQLISLMWEFRSFILGNDVCFLSFPFKPVGIKIYSQSVPQFIPIYANSVDWPLPSP